MIVIFTQDFDMRLKGGLLIAYKAGHEVELDDEQAELVVDLGVADISPNDSEMDDDSDLDFEA